MPGAITSGDALEEVIRAWVAADVNGSFLALRQAGDNQNDQVLHERTAKPGTPRPYCVYTQEPGVVNSRMSYDATGNREIKVARYVFTVYAKTKSECVSLTERIKHTIEGNRVQQLFTGCVMRVNFIDDYSDRDGEEEPNWTSIYDVMYDAGSHV